LATLLQEAAGIYGEQGLIDEAHELYQVLDALGPQVILASQDPLKYAAALRRQSTVIGAGRGPDPTVKAMLREARDASGGDENTAISAANTEAWLLISSGHADDAVDILEELYVRYRDRVLSPAGAAMPVAMTAWNAAELMFNFALALTIARPTGFKPVRDNALLAATKLFEVSGARPFKIRSDLSPTTALSGLPPKLVPVTRPPLPPSLAAKLQEAVKLATKRAGLI